MASKFHFSPLSQKNWPDLEQLFGDKGACGGCWCMTWRLPGTVYQQTKGEHNKKLLHAMVKGKEPLGVLLYANNEPIGWCSVSPKKKLLAQKKSKILQKTNFASTWSIICLFILPAYRRKGIATRLIESAFEYAISQGAQIVEAYPVIPKNDLMPDVFAWTGIWKSYKKAGFHIVAQPSTSKYIMQRLV